MKIDSVILRCEDHAEAVVFHKCIYKNLIYDKINNMFYVDKIELYDIETYCDADERKYKDVDIKRIEVFKADNFDKFNF